MHIEFAATKVCMATNLNDFLKQLDLLIIKVTLVMGVPLASWSEEDNTTWA